MSNPTTPFSWQMPTSTDLVTDLPADFEVFGQAVATSMADLLGGTTGQILAKTSATDMDFTWTTPNPGDITGVTAGVGITGGGTSGDVTVTNDMATTITAAGDIVVGTGSGTYDNLPIGTTAQVLTADTTVSPYKVKWATPSSGALTLISRVTYSAVGNQSFNGVFTSTYKSYLVIIENHACTGVSDFYFRFKDGATIQNTSYYGQNFSYNSSSTLVNTASSNAAALDIIATVGVLGTDSTSAQFFVHNVGVANANGVFSQIAGQAITSANGKITTFGGAHKLANADNDGFYIDPATGTISGIISIYGVSI